MVENPLREMEYLGSYGPALALATCSTAIRADAGCARRAAGLERLKDEPGGRRRSPLEERFLPSSTPTHPMPAPQRLIIVGDERYQVDCLWPDAGEIVELDGLQGHGTRTAFREDRSARPTPEGRRLSRRPHHLEPARRRTGGGRRDLRALLTQLRCDIQTSVITYATNGATAMTKPSTPHPLAEPSPDPANARSAPASAPCARRWASRLRDLAERSGVSAPMLSQVERGETSPTLAVAAKIAAGPRADAVAAAAPRRGPARRDQPRRRPPPLRSAAATAIEELTPPLPGPARRRLPARARRPAPPPAAAPTRRCTSPAAARPRSSSPATLALVVDGSRHELQEGDSVTFDADLPHHFENEGKEPTRFIAVIAAGLRRS